MTVNRLTLRALPDGAASTGRPTGRPMGRPIGGNRAPSRPLSRWLARFIEGPWATQDAISLAGYLAVGAVGLLVAWIGCSGTVRWNNQQAWTALAVGSVVLSLIGIAGWLRTGVQKLRTERLTIVAQLPHGEVAERRLPEPEAVVWATDSLTELPGRAPVVVGEGMTIFHRPTCVFAEGKALRRLRRDQAVASLQACPVCRP
jgi:hypothetical protein